MLLIDNVEQGLNPEPLRDVIESLRQAASRREGFPLVQVILSTHSPAVLDHFQPEEVTLLARPREQPDGPVTARPLSSVTTV